MLGHAIAEGVEDGPICHYLSLPKLLRLVTESVIFFPKLQCFRESDPYECTLWPTARYPTESLEELREWAKMLALLCTRTPNLSVDESVTMIRRLREEIARADIASVRELIRAFEIREWADGLICNCWHMNAEESDAMWKIYSGQSGAAIFTTVKQLASGIIGYAVSNSYEAATPWTLAKVIYLNEEELNNLHPFYVEHPWLLKRRGFEHERELRLFKALAGGDRAGSGHDVRVNTSAVINRIVLSPFNAEWENKAIKTALRELWMKRFTATPLIVVSGHLRDDREEARLLVKVEELRIREENLAPLKALVRLPAKLLLRGGRTDHPTDEDWILHQFQYLLNIWDGLPNATCQAVLVEEFREILKFTRNENVAREAWHKLEAIRAKIFEIDPKGEKVDLDSVAEVVKFLRDQLKI